MKARCYFKNSILHEILSKARLVAFDMNGLIIDDEEVQLESVNLALSQFRITIDEERWIRECVGKRADIYFKAILEEHGIIAGADEVNKIVQEKNKLYRALIEREVKSLIRPGVRELITYIAEGKTQILALVTSALEHEIETILGEKGLDLKDRFQYIISGADVSKSKPDPQIYVILTCRSGVPPQDCLVFEDSGPGVDAAHGAGMPCIAMPNCFTRSHDFSNAAYVIDSLTSDARLLTPPVL